MSLVLKTKLWNEKLCDTLECYMGKYLVYIDEYSKYWGCGCNDRLVQVMDPQQYPGNNKMGELLMSVLQDLPQIQQNIGSDDEELNDDDDDEELNDSDDMEYIEGEDMECSSVDGLQ